MLLVTRSFGSTVMPQLFHSSSIFSTVWLLAYFLFFAILIVQTSMTLADYLSHPVNVDISLVSDSSELEFPAIAVCNNNIVKKSYISRVTYLRDLALLDKFTFSDFLYQTGERQNCTDEGMFACKDGKCIPQEWVCNNRTECTDKSDENATICEKMAPMNHSSICIEGC